MQISSTAQRLLKLIFAACSASGALTRPRLERQSGLSARALHGALEELAQGGLLDARRLRLTLPGLAFAVACGARAKPVRRAPARQAERVIAINAPIALFFEREPPRAVA